MAKVAYSPSGVRITGTADRVLATAWIGGGWEKKDDGTFEFEYAGESELDWDSQQTITRKGKRVFVDENWNEWTEDQLVLREEAEEDEEADDREPDTDPAAIAEAQDRQDRNQGDAGAHNEPGAPFKSGDY